MKNKQTIIIPTSGAVNPGVPRGRSPLSVNLFGRLLGESKSANFAYLESPQRSTFFCYIGPKNFLGGMPDHDEDEFYYPDEIQISEGRHNKEHVVSSANKENVSEFRDFIEEQ